MVNNNANEHDDTEKIDSHKRRFLIRAATIMGGIGASFALTPFISSWLPNAKTKALAEPVQVDLSKLEPGQQMTVMWQSKPVWIIRRTPAMLAQLSNPNNHLRDPNSITEQQPVYAKNLYRSINPEYLVLIAVCTHLGCSPKYISKENKLIPAGTMGIYCPCHGSTFDMAGRVFKGVPAPINLQVPPYCFLSEKIILIGEEKLG